MTVTAMMSPFITEDARRSYSHPQDRLVWCIGKVGLPILLKLRTKLCQLGLSGAPLDPGVDRASYRDRKSEKEIISKYSRTCA